MELNEYSKDLITRLPPKVAAQYAERIAAIPEPWRPEDTPTDKMEPREGDRDLYASLRHRLLTLQCIGVPLKTRLRVHETVYDACRRYQRTITTVRDIVIPRDAPTVPHVNVEGYYIFRGGFEPHFYDRLAEEFGLPVFAFLCDM